MADGGAGAIRRAVGRSEVEPWLDSAISPRGSASHCPARAAAGASRGSWGEPLAEGSEQPYAVEHIAGERGTRSTRPPPSCSSRRGRSAGWCMRGASRSSTRWAVGSSTEAAIRPPPSRTSALAGSARSGSSPAGRARRPSAKACRRSAGRWSASRPSWSRAAGHAGARRRRHARRRRETSRAAAGLPPARLQGDAAPRRGPRGGRGERGRPGLRRLGALDAPAARLQWVGPRRPASTEAGA
jgi:hypothetical protein